jgi:hypothetical protein
MENVMTKPKLIDTITDAVKDANAKKPSLHSFEFGTIQFPMLQNRWQLDSITGLEEQENDYLRNQLTLAHFEFDPDEVSRFGFDNSFIKHRLLLVFEEPLKGGLAEIITKLTKLEKFTIVIDNLDGDLKKLKRTTYRGCNLMKYNYHLNYAASETCKFNVKFIVDSVTYS